MDGLSEFQQLIDENRYNFCKLVFVLFPFGEKGSDLENMMPYRWQMEEWAKLSRHLSNPLTRYETYRLIVSSGNGAAKTAFGAMTVLMLMYTQRVKGRITANTDPQMKSIVWPEYDIWFQRARFHDVFFEKFGTSIKARDEKYSESWRFDTITWSEQSPSAISGLHNKGGAAVYVFEEAPGIPSVIWKYAAGAFTETETIKIHMAFGNSDDPESQFEQNMASPLWHARRIDTRTLEYIDPKQIEAWLVENGGNEDADDFRVRVRGLPRKTARDSIIQLEQVQEAFARGTGFDMEKVQRLPCIIGVDPAWTGGDETVIVMRQGPYARLLEAFRLDKSEGQDHMFTFLRICYWEKQLGADAVFIDQAEGTGIFTLANNSGRSHWQLIAFAGKPTDFADPADSPYANIRAMMYYEAKAWFMNGAILACEKKDDRELFEKQLCWTKGARHKVTGKKLAESKTDIKVRVGQSPDRSDALVLTFAYPIVDRLPENEIGGSPEDRMRIGQGAFKMPDHPSPYDDIEDVIYERLYD